MRSSGLLARSCFLFGATLLFLLSGCGGGEEAAGAAGEPTGDGSAAEVCVDAINKHRASINLPPYARWSDAEGCTSDEAKQDSASGAAHGAFGACEELAQNECPGWDGPPAQMIPSCLQMMWDEGPGDDFGAHGHFTNMSSTSYTKVACGFFTLPDGKVWSAQNFK
jgi:hypothetical protein